MLKSDYKRQKINYDKLKFVKLNNVLRETLILFESYENFLLKQNKHFNLATAQSNPYGPDTC